MTYIVHTPKTGHNMRYDGSGKIYIKNTSSFVGI